MSCLWDSPLHKQVFAWSLNSYQKLLQALWYLLLDSNVHPCLTVIQTVTSLLPSSLCCICREFLPCWLLRLGFFPACSPIYWNFQLKIIILLGDDPWPVWCHFLWSNPLQTSSWFFSAYVEDNSVSMSILIIVLAKLDFTFQVARPYIGQYNSEINLQNSSLIFCRGVCANHCCP